MVLVCVMLVLLWVNARFRDARAVHRLGPGAARPPQPYRLGRWRWPALGFCSALVADRARAPGRRAALLGDEGDLTRAACRRDLALGLAANSLLTGVGAAIAGRARGARRRRCSSAATRAAVTRTIERVGYAGYALPGIIVALALVFFATRAVAGRSTRRSRCWSSPSRSTTCRSRSARSAPRSRRSRRGSRRRRAGSGGGPLEVFRTITAPLVRGGILAGAALVFLHAIKELPATLILAPIGFETLATEIWNQTSYGFFEASAIPALILLRSRRRRSTCSPSGACASASDASATVERRRARRRPPRCASRGLRKPYGADARGRRGRPRGRGGLDLRPARAQRLRQDDHPAADRRARAPRRRRDRDRRARLVRRRATFVAPERRRIGMVFQDYALFPHLDVAGNVGYGLGRKPDRERVARGARAGRPRRPRPSARCTSSPAASSSASRSPGRWRPTPELILLDEPFSNLDAGLRDRLRQEVREILARAGVTALFVTHDQDEALSIAETVAVMRDGVIEQVGTPEEIYSRPASRWVARFLGEVEVVPGEAAGGRVELRAGLVLGRARGRRARSTCCVRPESIAIGISGPEGAAERRGRRAALLRPRPARRAAPALGADDPLAAARLPRLASGRPRARLGRRPDRRAPARARLSAGADEIWREPVRGGYPDLWLFTRPGSERLEGFATAPRPRRRSRA